MLLTKFGCGRICCTCTPTCVISVFDTTSYKKVLSYSFGNLFNLSCTKGKFLNSCPTCWQFAHANVTSTMGWVVITDILCWTSGRSVVPMTCTFGQTIWWSGYVCWITIGAATISTGSTNYWKPYLCESFCSKLHRCSN